MARELILFKSGQGAAGARGVAGPSGAAGTPAPNVTSATGAAVYSMAGAASVFGFAGVITLPTGHADYAHLAEIQVEAQAPGSTSWQPVARVMRASFGGATVAYAGGEWAMPTAAAATWSVRVVAVNEYGSPTAAPVAISVTVDASKVTGFTSAAEAGARFVIDANNDRLPYLTVAFVPVLAGGRVPQNITYLVSADNGAYWAHVNAALIASVGQTVSCARPAPTVAQTWKVAAAAGFLGAAPTGANGLIADDALGTYYPGVVRSAGFAVAAIAPPGNLGSTLTIPAGAGGTWPYDATLPGGHHYWVIPGYTWSDTPRNSSAFDYRVTAEDLGVGGVSVRAEEATSGTMLSPSGAIQTASLMGEYGRAGNGANRTGNIEAVRLRLYLCSRVDQSTDAWKNPLASSLQNTVTITVAVGAAIPVDLVDLGSADPTTFGSQFTFRDGRFDGLYPQLSDGILNGGFEDRSHGWTLTGSVLIDATPFGTVPPTGSYSLTFGPNATVSPTAKTDDKYQVKPGEKYVLKALAKQAGANADLWVATIAWDSAGTPYYSIGALSSASSHTAWAEMAPYIFTVPAGVCFIQFYLQVWNGGLGNSLLTAGFWSIDNIRVERQVGSDEMTDYAVTAAKLADGAVESAKILDGALDTMAKFAATNKPCAIYTSNPALPDSHYPVGTYGFNTTTRVYQRVNAAGNGWEPAIKGGADIQAGSITADRIDVATLNAAVGSFGYVTTTYLSANYASISYLSANYISAATIAATYITAGTVSATYATISALNAKTITADKITGGICNALVSFTAPTITVSGSGFTIYLDSANGFKVTKGTATASVDYTGVLKFNAVDGSRSSSLDPFSISTVLSGGSSATMSPGGLTLSSVSGGSMVLAYDGVSSIAGQAAFTGTLAAAIAAGKSVKGGIIC